MSRELILRCRAAAYLQTSIVVMTEAEYRNYLIQSIDFRYPHLKMWNDAYERSFDTHTAVADEINQVLAAMHNVPAGYADNIARVISKIYDLYQALTFQAAAPGGVDLYEWWLGTPTGAESCSRDIGELRQDFAVGKGDEWELDLEAAILQYQINQDPFIPIPTGYACLETLRRLRMNA